ncbi:hypothetical protein PLICRDRAFT_173018 [Plicaturopsis crispa FD-325 SS-3]|nr:hypothetical protein PLICRDRAFT_173018 [Plicaturopsis crispa FD-325 SS-3]
MSASIENVADKTFDYVIAGGGTAGLTLAARLSEDPATSVLVLEAGKNNIDDPNTTRLGEYGKNFGQDLYDWGFKTTPQKCANDMEYGWNRGKGLGGTSALNFLCWTKPPAEDIDDWEKLGNPGWNWANYLKYSQKTEKFVQPSKEFQAKNGHNYDRWTIGTEGVLPLTPPSVILDIELKLKQTLENLGIPSAPDPYGGNPHGTFFVPNTIDPKTFKRTYSATAYYAPNADRQNLSVLVGAYTHKLVTETDPKTGLLIATGVEFSHGDRTHVVHVRKEAILSAGALKSPQILELSGIGRRDVLEPLGIPVKLELDRVGENLQEHNFIGSSFEIPDDVPGETFDLLRDPESQKRHLELHPTGQGAYNMGITIFSFNPLKAYSPRADELLEGIREKVKKNGDSYPPGVLDQYKILIERLERGAPGPEVISYPGLLTVRNPPVQGKRYLSILSATNHPFSRGSVHITSTDPKVHPAFDPHYFEEDIDLQNFIETVKFAREIPHNSPLKELLGSSVKELNPGSDIVTDEEIGDHIKKYMSSTYHSAGTLSMLPRDKGGVVDPKLKVYGTSNIRVVDLSIVPIHFASHSLATAYTIAEQAADIIKGKI